MALPDRRVRPWFSCFEGKLMFTQLVKDQGTVRVSNESRLELVDQLGPCHLQDHVTWIE